LVLAAVPFAMVGGVIALFLTGTPFSISAAVGFLSVFGVSIQGALVSISQQHEYVSECPDLREAVLKNAAVRMRPVMMTTLSACIGLIPAAVATGIGAQSQQPLARVVVGGMLSALLMILFVLPVLYAWTHRRSTQPATRPSMSYVARPTLTLLACVFLSLFSGCRGEADSQPPSDSGDRQSVVRISPKAQQQITIESALPRPLSNELAIQGRIQYSPDRYVVISSPMSGIVRAVHGKLGQSVTSEESLLTIESPDIITAYASLTTAEADLRLARRSYHMTTDLYRAKALPKKELEQAENDLNRTEAEYQRSRKKLLALKVPASELDQPEAKRKITSRFELKPSLDGVVVEKKVTVGQLVEANETLYTVANLDILEAIGDIYERDLRLVRPGLPVSIAVESLPDMIFHGVVRHVGDVVDPTSRTIKIRCDVSNPDHDLKVDVFARIMVELTDQDRVLTVPRKAVIQLADQSFVFVRRAPDEYERREVQLGMTSGEFVEIREGLKNGEEIAVTGTLLLEGALQKQVT
jgi:cobalt-zinc-cadmium efflux system membrane fusion protein